jgi:hypothetical protein
MRNPSYRSFMPPPRSGWRANSCKRRGGSPQRFCRARCGTAFWSALRRWGERAIAAGVLTVIDLRHGATAACTLQGEPVLRGSPPSPRTWQFPPCSSRGERRRKLTGWLDDFLPRLVRYRRHALVRGGASEPRQCLLLDMGPVLRSSTRLFGQALTAFPRVPSSEAFERRPLSPGRSLTLGRHPKP